MTHDQARLKWEANTQNQEIYIFGRVASRAAGDLAARQEALPSGKGSCRPALGAHKCSAAPAHLSATWLSPHRQLCLYTKSFEETVHTERRDRASGFTTPSVMYPTKLALDDLCFIQQPNEIDVDDLEPDNESVDTPLVSPFLDSDDDSDDGEVLNELEEYGKDNGENIMKSIKEGPFQMGTVSDVITGGTEGAVQQGPVRARVLNDLSAEEKERYKADIRATNILLQGIPKDIYSLINHYTDAKDIWENVKMILEGSELTKDDRESQLYDEFEHFRQIKGEGIQGYYVRFTKLINDMRNIKMTMSRMQLNSKFVNNMLPEWSRFITEVKLNRGLKESNCDQLYAYLKQHEVHANENRIMMERFGQPNTDPLALVSDASAQQYPTQSSKSPQSSTEPYPSDNFQMNSGSSSTENLIESLTNSLALLTQSYKSHLPQTNNQLRASSNARNKAMVQDGKVVVQDVRGRYNATNQGRPFQRNNARGNGVAGNVTNVDDDVDDSTENDLALNVDHIFEADECDAFDSDVDEGPTSQTMFMANITSKDPIYDEAGTSYDSNNPFK
ncbi:hypothetical protein Tco_0536170, partial [Tanacetum coccineum]